MTWRALSSSPYREDAPNRRDIENKHSNRDRNMTYAQGECSYKATDARRRKREREREREKERERERRVSVYEEAPSCRPAPRAEEEEEEEIQHQSVRETLSRV
jgi:hypothetical protein